MPLPEDHHGLPLFDDKYFKGEEFSFAGSYYELLGISRTASVDAIKTAYHNMLYHPDKNSSSKKADKVFAAISTAFQVLSDPKAKQSYDQKLFPDLASSKRAVSDEELKIRIEQYIQDYRKYSLEGLGDWLYGTKNNLEEGLTELEKIPLKSTAQGYFLSLLEPEIQETAKDFFKKIARLELADLILVDEAKRMLKATIDFFETTKEFQDAKSEAEAFLDQMTSEEALEDKATITPLNVGRLSPETSQQTISSKF